MTKHVLFAVAELLLLLVPMPQTKPITISVVELSAGIRFVYDTTGTVEFHSQYYDGKPSKIHHYIHSSEGLRLFLFTIEVNPQERILIRANSVMHAQANYAIWTSKQGRHLRMDEVTIHEAYEHVTDEMLCEKGYYSGD